MRISIQIKNINEALKKFDTLKKDLQEPFREVIQGGAQLIRGEAIKDIQTGVKSGRIYEKYNPIPTRKDAEELEEYVANKLRKERYGVWFN